MTLATPDPTAALRDASQRRAEELRALAAISWRPCSACLALGGYRAEAPMGQHWPVAGHSHARPEQLPPVDDWRVWLLLAGRGFGKTRSAAEWFHEIAMANPGALGAIVPPTFADGRDICVEGPSGLIAVAPEPWKSRMREFQAEIRKVLESIKRVARENDALIRQSIHHVNEALNTIAECVERPQQGYDARGWKPGAAAMHPAMIDRQG